MSQDAAIRQASGVQREILRRRAGQPYSPGVLLQAGVIGWGEAHADWRAGAWAAGTCGACADWFAGTLEGGIAIATRCPSCLGTGQTWSGRHAELMAYAGEASLQRVVHFPHSAPALNLTDWLADLPGYSPHAALAAALGVAQAWRDHAAASWKKGLAPPLGWQGETATLAALDAVRAWLWEPSRERRQETVSGITDTHHCPVSALCLAVNRQDDPQVLRDLLYRARSLPPDALSAAARQGVRGWVGRGVLL